MNNLWALDFANTVSWDANVVLAGSIVAIMLLLGYLTKEKA